MAYIERAALVDRLLDTALSFLEHDDWYLEARVKARATPADDHLYRTAHMLGEHRETFRRHFADAIIALRPELHDRIRLVCRFSATQPSSGVCDTDPTR